jgi:hypothetical protein
MTKRIGSSGLRRTAALVIALVLAGAMASCTGAAATPSASNPAASLRVAVDTSAAALPAAPALSPSSAPTGRATAFPAPAEANWTTIHWTKVAGKAAVWADLPDSDNYPAGVDDESGWHVLGWSGGYVAFNELNMDNGDVVTQTSNSTDGIHWTPGDGFKWTGSSDDSPFTESGIGAVLEGPAGLLAVDISHADCGSDVYEWPVAVSADGISWHTVTTALGSGLVGSGPAGYIMAGSGGISTSTDGIAWKPVDLKAAAFKGLVEVTSGTAFAGGFVISGLANTPDTSCAGGAIYKGPALWWSPDGSTWTRDTVPGASAGSMAVCRFGATLVAGEPTSKGGLQWRSTDGQTWKPVSVGKVVLCPHDDSDVGDYTFMSYGPNSLAASKESDAIYAIHADLALLKLAQTGELPNPDTFDGVVAVGPAGLIGVDDDGNTYLGALSGK